MLHASRSDPSGLSRAEAFWNSLDCGRRPQYLGQFQLSFSAESRWVPAPSAQSHPVLLGATTGMVEKEERCDVPAA